MSLPPHIADIFQTMSGWFMNNTFADRTDRACAIAAYRRNNEEVRDTIPAERLLVFNVAEGWGPLCRFLETPEPPRLFRAVIRGTNFGRISAASQPSLQFTSKAVTASNPRAPRSRWSACAGRRNSRFTSQPAGMRRVGVWRGGFRSSMSVCRPFRLAVP